MDAPVRVLFVAASAADAEPWLEELGRAGLEVSGEVVGSAVEMQAAIGNGVWDLVLSDGEFPGFGVLPALALAEAAGLDAPFLVVSESVSEDGAVRALRAGAPNRRAKDFLPGLASSVERELAESRLRRERRRARHELKESESRFRALAETGSDAVLTADGDGRIVFANRAAERVFGYPVTAIVGRPIERLVPGVLELAAPAMDAPPAPDAPIVEQVGRHATGRDIPLDVSIGSFWRNGRRFATVLARDVTERRNAENALRESEARKSAMIEAALDAILSIDAAGCILEFNVAAERMFGYSRSAVLGKSMADLLIPPSLRERHRRGMAHHLATGEAPIFGKTLEMTAMRADGTEFPIELTVTRLSAEGPPVFTGYIHDLTDRRLAESALRESEERFRVAAQISSDLVYEWNIETGDVLFLHARPGSSQGAPSTREEWEKLLHPEDRERVVASMRRTLETDRPFFEEYRIVLDDGSVRFRVGYGKVLRDGEGRALKWIGVNKDVTERRRTANALQDSEQKLRTLVTNVPVVLFAIDRQGIFTHSEGKGLESLGLEPGELVGKSVWDFYRGYPDVLEHFRSALSGDAHTATVRLGAAFFETRYAPYSDPDGRVMGVIGVAIDVTEQRRADQLVRSSEARYRTLFERNLAGVFRSTLEGRILECNESFARIFGYASPAEALHKPALDFYLRPGDRKTFLARLSERHTVSNYEMCARRGDGTPV